MANVDGIVGYNSPTGISKLLAALGNDVVDVSTGLGYSLNLSSGNKVFFEIFMDTVFMVNGVNPMRSFDGSKWSQSLSLPRNIIPKYIKKSAVSPTLLIGNCIVNPGGVSAFALNYKSRVFRSNKPTLITAPNNQIRQTVTWGFESGAGTLYKDTKKLKATIESDPVRYPYFKSGDIKVGNPLFSTSVNIPGANVQYTVARVDSEYELTVNEIVDPTLGGNSNTIGMDPFWVGGNWFDVGTDDNDEIMGFGENNSRDLIFKLFSLWYYTGSQLKQVKGALGTSSQRSVINDQTGNTYYFHGSDIKKTGIYRFDGSRSVRISRAVDKFIQGMNASNYGEVTAWEEGDELRWYIGDISNNNDNISMSKVVVSLNTATGAWDVSPINDVITCATKYIDNDVQHAYCGTNDSQVLKMADGYNFNGSPIASVLETGIHYPSGSELINEYPYIQVISKNGKGIRISYKIWNDPYNPSDDWIPLGELLHDKEEFEPDIKMRVGSGIQFRIEENGILENNWLVEKISVFYKPDRTRLL